VTLRTARSLATLTSPNDTRRVSTPDHEPDPTVMSRLRTALAEGPELRLAVLFGSHATGRARADSDVDVALCFVRADVSLADELDLQLVLERAVGRTVDLVRLDEASTLVRWQIATCGVPIVAREHEWPRFQARAASEYADFRPAFEAAAERFRRRLAGGAP
jgi:predicted nucleotidyltransferase